MDSGLNTINPAAFAAEHAQVVQQIADLNARKQTIDPAQRAAIAALVHRIGFDGGVPQEAAIVLAQRIVALESKLSQPCTTMCSGWKPKSCNWSATLRRCVPQPT